MNAHDATETAYKNGYEAGWKAAGGGCRNKEQVFLLGLPIDPCSYKEVEVIENATVRILKCRVCGKTEIEWERQK